MSAEKTRAVIEQELGETPIKDVFEWIELNSVLGSASIAQVRTCTLRSPKGWPHWRLAV